MTSLDTVIDNHVSSLALKFTDKATIIGLLLINFRRSKSF